MRFEKANIIIKLARLLAGTAEGLTLDEIAIACHVSRRTAERLKATIEAIFPQLEAITDGRKLRFRISGGLDRFLQAPTSDELAELYSAAKALEMSGSSLRANLLNSLGEKLKSSLRPSDKHKLAPDIDALTITAGYVTPIGPQPLADPNVLETVRSAIKSGSCLTFVYGKNANSRRTVSPWGILYGRSYYLVGPIIGKQHPALWRFDKLHLVEIGGQSVLPPAGWSIAKFTAQSFGVFQEKPQKIILRFKPQAAYDASRFLFHHNQTTTLQSDGSVVIQFVASGSLEIANHLFTWGNTVEIVEPHSLREKLCEMLEAAFQHHKATTISDALNH
ncbi:helix-turn-helix transcriptional regulator [Acetobacter sp. AAB5]|uniref:helix-turn-helix transcriptional regulator n=1 Tax=Acetobacter sp. AAB5 TaxID=3418370 RepID=UPI003CED21C3